MTLTVRRRPSQLFCRVSCPRVAFLLPQYKTLVYNVGKCMYTSFLTYLLFMHVQNYSVLFSYLYVFVLCFLLICGLAWGAEGEHLPGAS